MTHQPSSELYSRTPRNVSLGYKKSREQMDQFLMDWGTAPPSLKKLNVNNTPHRTNQRLRRAPNSM